MITGAASGIGRCTAQVFASHGAALTLLDRKLEGLTDLARETKGHAFAADAATWRKHLEDPAKNPLPPGVIGPLFTDVERFDLIEYLKIHQDPPTPEDYQPPVCHLWGQAL